MPHVSSSGGDDLASSDEVKVYKDEGEEGEPSSENLSEDKLGLVTETEEGKSSTIPSENYSRNVKEGPPPEHNGIKHTGVSLIDPYHPTPIGYVVTPYPYPNGATSLASSKMPMVQSHHAGALGPLMVYSNDHPFSTPPPAHLGYSPVSIDPKTGLPRHPMYALPPPPGQFPLYRPDISQVQWSPPGYPITTAAFGGHYPPSLSTAGTFSRFTHPGFMPPHPGFHPGLTPPPLLTTGPKQEHPPQSQSQENHRHQSLHEQGKSSPDANEAQEKKKPHIKKPLNAFMLFMKEQRAKVVAECTLKESAAINQILGRKWHALDRSEQQKYYEMARKEKELHMQLYPGWSARDNYACHTKRKKRKRQECQGEKDCNNPKKCRARFGVDQQHQWCKPCRRKKKCIRFLMGDDEDEDDDDDENASDAEDQAGSVPHVDSTNDPENTNSPDQYGHHSDNNSDSDQEILKHNSGDNECSSTNTLVSHHHHHQDALPSTTTPQVPSSSTSSSTSEAIAT
ncbi:transcription factor 7-like 2 isoform X1 [Lingula anatina]|uniref:Transcription factor 7-like 2 isoform X1 n=1 Tax=Lingula anatina TaxID=7574 RepID=A0A1S3HKH0_LINAN|nr:transcription factor 7-like 2 isoform X1 [Lingula anatina]|eukprot:XP_013385961.1 transcription factor 7-like 2 isoform X1 [Lingula anatina]